jgi:hypothetical protein
VVHATNTTTRNWGIVLVCISAIMAVTIPCLIARYLLVDFPCEGTAPPPVSASTRIAYCISYIPRNAISGGGIYAHGSSDDEVVTVTPNVGWHGSLTLERQGEGLVVDGHLLHPGDSFSRLQWWPTLNLWVLFTHRMTVTNEGVSDGPYQTPTDAAYLSGDVVAGWLPSPVGLVVLVIGIVMIIRGTRRSSQSQ